MEITNEVKKKLLEELIEMMGDMETKDMPKKGAMLLEDEKENIGAEEEMDEECDTQGLNPMMMELLKKKKAEKMARHGMAGMRMAH